MWQIVTVAVLGLRLKAVFVPLIARAGVILAAVSTTIVLQMFNQPTLAEIAKGAPEGINEKAAVLPALLLLLVAALASLPLPRAVPPIIPALAETLAAALILGAIGPDGAMFILYLVIPFFLAATTTGLAASLGCSVTGLATMAAMIAIIGKTAEWTAGAGLKVTGGAQPSGEPAPTASLILAGACIFVGVPLLGSWMRRITQDTEPDSEVAYADAHELLSELHVVARQLSLGLDPRTLAAALSDDIRTVVPQSSSAVMGRSPGGRFIALTGDEPPDEAGTAIEEAWRNATPAGRDHDGQRFTAVPVLMGLRVVAMVVISTKSTIDTASLRQCQSLIGQSGPRLASAMLFDDVRRLATTDERMRLAREIHDGIAQDLASVGYLLDDIRRDSDATVADRVTAVREQLQLMVGDLRMSIFDLRSGIDDAISLGTALSDHAQRIGSQAGLVVHVSMDESPKRLPISVEVELLRIVQEAITNVRRHAKATNLWISITVEPPKAHITVSDDGRGLRSGRADSFGITGMRERARRIGASLSVGSGPDGGTVVEVALGTDPLTQHESHPLPRTVISRGALTDPHGLPVIRPANGSDPSTGPASTSGQLPQPLAHATRPGDAKADQEMTQ